MPALAGLAVLDLAADDTATALQRLRKAYDLNRSQPSVLNILANFMIQKGSHDKVRPRWPGQQPCERTSPAWPRPRLTRPESAHRPRLAGERGIRPRVWP